MINPMNEGTSGITDSTLHGNHVAKIIYCKDVVYGGKGGVLRCDDIVLMSEQEIRSLDKSKLNWDDRVFFGVVRVETAYVGENVFGKVPEVQDDSEE